MSTKEIDCDDTKEVVCPHCGYELSDSWELGDDGRIECPECEKEFEFRADYETTYTSWIPVTNPDDLINLEVDQEFRNGVE